MENIYIIGNRNLEVLKYFLWLTTVCCLTWLYAVTNVQTVRKCQAKLINPVFIEMEPPDLTRKSMDYKKTSIKRRSVPTNYTYTILWHDSPSYFLKKAHISLRRCKFNNCMISTNTTNISEADVVIFRHNYLPFTPPVKSPEQIWVLFSQESPFYIRRRYQRNEWRNKFNWSMTYRNADDVTMNYASIVKDTSPKWKNYSEIFQKKTKQVAWIVSHCWSISERDHYVKELQKYIPVDIFGRCGNLECPRNGTKCLDNIITNYKFFLSFENSICEDYVSEKVFSLFNRKYNLIPIIRAAPNVDKFVPRKTYINVYDFETPQTLANYLLKLSSDEYEYTLYLREKDQYKAYYASYYRAMCSMCEKVNTYSTTTIVNTSSWFSIKNNCLIPQNKSLDGKYERDPDYWYWD